MHNSPRVDFTYQPIKKWRCKLKSPPWHCPPTAFASAENKYQGVDTFAVIRNPYSRILSEYHWVQRTQNQPFEETNNRDRMNSWIMEALDSVKEKGTCAMGHCIPSHRYIFDEGKQIVTHILRMENLTDDFHSLMHEYNLPIALEHTNVQPHESTHLGLHDLSPDAIGKINEWARMDFEYFGYEMMDPGFNTQDQSAHLDKVRLFSLTYKIHTFTLFLTLMLFALPLHRRLRSLRSARGLGVC